jgi:hypothetical protein
MKDKVSIPVAVTTIVCLLGGIALGYFLAMPTSCMAGKAPVEPSQTTVEPKRPLPPAPVPHGNYRAKGPQAIPEYFRGTYLDLMKMALTDLLYERDPKVIERRVVGGGLAGPRRNHDRT